MVKDESAANPEDIRSHASPLHALEDLLLEVALNLLAGLVGGGLAVEGKEVAEVELGCLEELDLADVDLIGLLVYMFLSRILVRCVTYVLERVDALCALLNLAANNLRNQLGDKLAEGAALRLLAHDVGHLLPDRADLRGARVGGLLNLVGPSLGEGDAEEAEEVVVGGLDDNVGLDEGLPLADERAQLVGCDVQAVEVGQAVLALDLVDAELDLAEGVVLILLEIGERSLEDAALERVVGVLETGGAVDEGLADAGGIVSIYCPNNPHTQMRIALRVYFLGVRSLSDGEGGGRLDGEPVLLREGVGPLLQALLAL